MPIVAPDLGAPAARVPPAEPGPRRQWRVDAGLLALGALVVRIPAFLAPRSLVFDDGVFASSALAMRAGGAPFRDVFSSQGPLFLPLVWLGDLTGARTINSPRVLVVVSGVVLTVAVYAIARHVTSRPAALLAAVLVSTSGSVLWVTGPLNADGPSMAAALSAVAVALRCRARRSTGAWWPLAIGVLAGLALSIKLLALPAVLVAGLVVLDVRRRKRDGLVTATTAAGVWLVASLPWGIHRVWEQSFAYHQQAQRQHDPFGSAWVVLRTLWDRDVVVVVIVALAGLGALLAWRRGEPTSASTRREARAPVVLAAWVLMTFALLVAEPALWRAHVSHIVPPLVLLAALRFPPARVLVAAIVVSVPFWAAHNHSVLLPEHYDGDEAALVHALARQPEGSLAISDEPGWVWRAGLRTPAALVDPSFQRIDAEQITAGVLARAARRPEVCAVVASSRQHFLRFSDLRRRLTVEGYSLRRVGHEIDLYVKEPCGARAGRSDGAAPPDR